MDNAARQLYNQMATKDKGCYTKEMKSYNNYRINHAAGIGSQ